MNRAHRTDESSRCQKDFSRKGTKPNACRGGVVYACRLVYVHMDGVDLEQCAMGVQDDQERTKGEG
jgi:hypothetical protein